MSTIIELSKLLHSGKISSVALTSEYISRIEKANDKLNAYVHTTFDKAMEQAKVADEMLASGKATLLTGIPMSLKDNISTYGIETTCCSHILQGYKPYYNATAWDKLLSQGAVLLGKTNMDEFAMGSTSETSCYGAPRNPVNTNYVTGGSSGGGASAVKAGLSVYSLGSDTGGSIRQPASFCGCVGFKPTYGNVSRYGLIAYGSSLDQIGPITNCVKDAEIVYNAIKGKDTHDNTSFDNNESRQLESIKGLKVAIADEFLDGINGEVSDAFNKVITQFEKDGAIIERISIPQLKAALPVYYIIACAEASSNLGRYDGIRYGYRASDYKNINDMVIKTRTQGFGKEVKKRIMLGTYVLSSGYYDAYYKKACLLRKQIVDSFGDIFSKYDVILAPSVPNTAFPLGYTGSNPIEMYLSDVCTVPINIAGLPSISIPCGVSGKGLPIGVQIISGRNMDNMVLQVASYYENVSPITINNEEGLL